MKLLLLFTLFVASLTAEKNLEIYFIDVEGGKSVLFVSPSHESLLFDVGWPNFNNIRASTDQILKALEDAGLKRIDSLVISHFDLDHMGDVPQLASKIPIGCIFDHGEIQATEAGTADAKQRFAPYAALRETIEHTTVHAGDTIPFPGVNVQVLSAGGKLITKPLPHAGAKNPLCATYQQAKALESDIEDDQSIGLLISFGKFRMLDLADLEAHYSRDLVCPANLIGTVDVLNVNVHGQFKGIAPELIGAVHAPVIVQANGARKGADAPTWPILHAAPGVKDIWQLHYSLNAGKGANPPENFIANPEGTDGFKWIKISVEPNGSFTVTNSRNGFSKRY
jgi:competence protein ComEC